MRKNSDIYAFTGNALHRLNWFLFVTSLLVFSFAHAADSEFVYDSSLQRSNFFTLNPDYENQLESETTDRRSQFFWKLRFDGQSLQTDNNIQSQIAGATFRGKFRYKLLNNVNFKAKGNLSLESGRSQDVFGDQEPGSGIYPREVKVEYKPWKDYLQFDVGLIHQRFFNEPLFISNLGFIGASEAIRIDKKRYSVGLRIQQLIPTSYTQSTRVAEREEVPYFFTETLDGRLNLSRNNFVKGAVTHFRYDNLPSTVAYDSGIYGNSIRFADRNNSEFEYDFEGFLTHLMFEQKVSNSLAAQIQWNTIVNGEAPSDAGEAQSYQFNIANDFGRWILGANYKTFFIESDAVPGAYNSHLMGHTNRTGNGYELLFESKDWGVMFRASYVRADLLSEAAQSVDGLQQDNQQTIYLSVETLYDFI